MIDIRSTNASAAGFILYRLKLYLAGRRHHHHHHFHMLCLARNADDFNLHVFIRRCDGRGLQALVLFWWEKPTTSQKLLSGRGGALAALGALGALCRLCNALLPSRA